MPQGACSENSGAAARRLVAGAIRDSRAALQLSLRSQPVTSPLVTVAAFGDRLYLRRCLFCGAFLKVNYYGSAGCQFEATCFRFGCWAWHTYCFAPPSYSLTLTATSTGKASKTVTMPWPFPWSPV